MQVEKSEKEKGGGNKNCLTTRERCMNITRAVNATENPKPCGLVRCRAYFFLLLKERYPVGLSMPPGRMPEQRRRWEQVMQILHAYLLLVPFKD